MNDNTDQKRLKRFDELVLFYFGTTPAHVLPQAEIIRLWEESK